MTLYQLSAIFFNAIRHTKDERSIDMVSNSELELLQYALKSGMINLGDVQKVKEMATKQELLQKHNNKIWQGKNGLWYTYLPDQSKPKNLKLIKRRTEDDIKNAIYQFYKRQNEDLKNKRHTLGSIYNDWLKYKSLHTNASNYIRRIDNDWVKYYSRDPIINVPIVDMTELMLDEWAHNKIKDFNLTRTQYYNMSIIMRQALEYAVGKQIIPKSPFAEVKVETKLLRKVKKKPDDTQVYLKNEISLIEQEAWSDFREKPFYAAPLAVLLAFQTGVRLGELVALKWSDINGNYIHVQRMESRVESLKDDGTWDTISWEVVDHVKTDAGDRTVYLTQKAKDILREIRKVTLQYGYRDDDYIFVGPNGRIHKRAVDSRIRKYCKNINIREKSAHKIRKTYISTLIDAGVNINTIRNLAGHRKEETTLGNYCFDRSTKEQKEEILEQALSSL